MTFELPVTLIEERIISKATDIVQVNLYQKDDEFYISITYEGACRKIVIIMIVILLLIEVRSNKQWSIQMVNLQN